MTELTRKYYHIMDMYKKGEFGAHHLSLHDILEKAGESDLFDKMNQNEIQYLIDNSSGLTKYMFIELKSKKNKTNLEIINKENFNVIAVPCDRAFVVVPEQTKEIKNQTNNKENNEQISQMAETFKRNNLINEGSVLKKTRKK